MGSKSLNDNVGDRSIIFEDDEEGDGIIIDKNSFVANGWRKIKSFIDWLN